MTALQNKSVVFVGGGNMASALIDGLLTQKTDFTLGVIDKNADKLGVFADKGLKTALADKGADLLESADIVVLAVKPQVLSQVCESIKSALKGKLIISIVAGITLDALSAMTDSNRLVRTMPNLPATVGLGATGLFANSVDDKDKALATAVMTASGITVWVDNENELHTVTAVAGSAPAYFFYMLEAMIDKAVAMGMDNTNAHALAVQAMYGAAAMAKDDSPTDLRAKVMSKGGTTYAAITCLQDNNVGDKLAAAMQACYDRSVELGR